MKKAGRQVPTLPDYLSAWNTSEDLVSPQNLAVTQKQNERERERRASKILGSCTESSSLDRPCGPAELDGMTHTANRTC